MQVQKIQNTNGYNTNFQARLTMPKEIKSETLKKAGEYLSKITDDNTNLCVQKDKLYYNFSIDNAEPKQPVGKDTMGFLLMEKTPKEIAGFLKSVIKAINERKKFVGAKLTEINNPNKTITEIFEQDEAIGKHAFQITLDRSGNEEYNKAADVIHVWG